MRTQAVHFTVSGEFITHHARELVKEGKTGGAWLLLHHGLPDLSADQIVAILSGRSKLVGDNTCTLADDDKSVDPRAFMAKLMEGYDKAMKMMATIEEFRGLGGLCHHVYHPPMKGRVAMRGSPVGLITENKLELIIGADFPQLLMELFPRFTDEEWEKFWTPEMIERFDEHTYQRQAKEVLELEDITSLPRYEGSRRRAQAVVEKMGIGVPSIDAYMAREREMEKRPTPKATKDYSSDNGWVLPDGKFYPCNGPMEHIWLADRLKGFTEKQAEDAGWVKVSLSPMFGDVHILNHKSPTQAQINTLFDWSKKAIRREQVYDKWLDRERVDA